MTRRVIPVTGTIKIASFLPGAFPEEENLETIGGTLNTFRLALRYHHTLEWFGKVSWNFWFGMIFESFEKLFNVKVIIDIFTYVCESRRYENFGMDLARVKHGLIFGARGMFRFIEINWTSGCRYVVVVATFFPIDLITRNTWASMPDCSARLRTHRDSDAKAPRRSGRHKSRVASPK